MKKPTASVIIPTYNRWPHVCKAVESVLAQTYAETDCIVVDDSSTDDTVNFLRDKYCDRLTVLRHPENREKSAARNTGIRAAESDYLCMLDSDDVLTPDSIEQRINVFLADKTFNGVSYGYATRQNGPREPSRNIADFPSGDVLDQYIDDAFLQNNDFMISKQNMLQYGMYREDLTHREDVELLIRLACHLEFRFCGVRVGEIRRVDESARSKFNAYTAQGTRMVEHLKADPTVRKCLGKRLVKLEITELKELARAHYKTGAYRNFRQYAMQLLRKQPRAALTDLRLLKRLLLSFLH